MAAGSLWAVAGNAGVQGLKLLGNIVLARLLFPEAFGVVAIVTAVVLGLQMLSDVGVAPGVLQHKRGDEPHFLRVAWTIQAVRGVALSFLAAAIAWPIASLYNEPRLLWFLPVAGLSTALAGLASVQMLRLNRRIELRGVTIVEVSSVAVSMAAAIVWSWLEPSIWPLVVAPVVAAGVKAIGSHIALPSFAHRLAWDRAVAADLLRFGKWIFFATVFGYVASRGNQLVLAGFLDKSTLGVYSMAFLLASAPVLALYAISSKVLLPAYARLAEEHSGPALMRRIGHARLTLHVLTLPILVVFAWAGEWLMPVIFGAGFAEGGWMLRMLAAGAGVTIIAGTAGAAFLPLGDSRSFMFWQLARGGLQIAAALIGHALFGVTGLIAGIALTDVVSAPALALLLHRRGLLQPLHDLATLAVLLALVAPSLLVGSTA